MSNVVDLDVYRPHLSGTAVCRNCESEHMYVAPVSMELGAWLNMECHECRKMTCHDKNFNVEWGNK